jgi:hypothetical protein
MLGTAGTLGGVEHAVRVGLALKPGQERGAGTGGARSSVGFFRPLDVGGDARAHGALFGGELPGHGCLGRTPGPVVRVWEAGQANAHKSCVVAGTVR